MSSLNCLSETKAKQIREQFHKLGLQFSRYNRAIYALKNISQSLQNNNSRKVSSIKRSGVDFANMLYIEIKGKHNPIHVELSWTDGAYNHAMALIFFPIHNTIEFFDPSGYSHKKDNLFLLDKVMYLFLDSFHKHLAILLKQKIIFVSMTDKSINPHGHCNTWCLYFHFATLNER